MKGGDNMPKNITLFECVSCSKYKFADDEVWKVKPEGKHFLEVIKRIKRKAICPSCAELIRQAK